MSGTSTWLGSPYPPSADDKKIREKLIELRVLESDADENASQTAKFGSKTPQTLQVITAGASQLSKWWIALAGGTLGAGALFQGIAGLGWDGFGTLDISPTQQAVLTASAAFVASALVLAIAIMVKGDVSSRALATAAQYNARAAATQALIAGFQYSAPAPELRAHYLVTTKNGTSVVKSFGRDGNGVFVVTDKETIRNADIMDLQPAPKAP